jgi:hypothetical protein
MLLGQDAEEEEFTHPLLDAIESYNNEFDNKITLYTNDVKIQNDDDSCLAFSLMFIREIVRDPGIIDRIIENENNQNVVRYYLRKIRSLPEEFMRYAQSVGLLKLNGVSSYNSLVSSPESKSGESKLQNRSIDCLKGEILELKEAMENRSLNEVPMPNESVKPSLLLE